MLAVAEDEIGAFERMDTAVVLREVPGLDDDVALGHRRAHLAAPQVRAAARRCRHWSSTTAATMIAPFTISW